MNVLTNPLFLTRLSGLIAFAVALYWPGTNEEKLGSVIMLVLTFVSGKFEKQPEVAKVAQESAKGASGSSANPK